MNAQQAAEKVRSTLTGNGYQAFLVGGAVRDLIIGRPVKDFDITTDAVPEEIVKIFPKTIPVGAAFGVIVVVQDEIQIEVATFRADGDYTDGRRPDTVGYSKTAKEDVVRRDFTINGLLLTHPGRIAQFVEEDTVTDLIEEGAVVDYVGGLADLDRRVIRCIGNPEDRFTEDALRMLRAVRFAAQLGFEIEKNTEAAICKMAHTINKVSKERIAAELFRLVSAPFPVKGLVPLVTTGLATRVAPWLSARFAPSYFAHTLRRFATYPTTDPLKGMAMLLEDYDRTRDCDHFLHELKLSNEQIEIIEGALTPIGDLDCMNLSQLKKLARMPGIHIALDLFEQTCGIDGGTGNALDGTTQILSLQANANFAEAIAKLRGFTPEEIRPRPLATGDDLIAMGLKPGPVFTKLLGALEIEQLNETVKTREEALEFLTMKATA
jgi:poly(A) polymerase